MTGSLQDKTVIISGATRGIGRAIALELAGEGADISFNYLKSDLEAKELEEKISGLGVRVKSFKADIRDYKAVKSWVDNTMESFGRIDVVVNNAGITRDKALAFMEPQEWHAVIDTNLNGTFNLTRAVIITFIKQRSGVIINVSSISGIRGLPGQTNYSASKAAIIGFTKSLAREIAPYNIRVNAIAPGFIETDMLKELSGGYRERILKYIPLSRLGRAEEVAKVVRFLTTDEARYITGQTIIIDGGMNLS
jgi:3-oxoacyl-[acyl-carrier protein] reductase